MNKAEVIQKTRQFVQLSSNKDTTGHDWWHIHRVYQTAKLIAHHESANLYIVELTALLHDIADWKFHKGDESIGPSVAQDWLQTLEVEESIIDEICHIILNMSFKGAGVKSQVLTLEGQVVQDADRLDAIGAIGIARTFAFGGAFSQPIHNPEIPIIKHNTFDDYKNKKTTSINHFYEKLLLLKNRMNTKTGKRLAEERHLFMQMFLNQFHQEWEGDFS